MQIIDYTGDLHDFSDTAALIAHLDLVISVDTPSCIWPAPWAGRCGRCCRSSPIGDGW